MNTNTEQCIEIAKQIYENYDNIFNNISIQKVINENSEMYKKIKIINKNLNSKEIKSVCLSFLIIIYLNTNYDDNNTVFI
jgi:hypothetical protein